METQILEYLRTPGGLDTLNLLEEGNGRKVDCRLISTRSRKEYPVYEGIPVLINNFRLKANCGNSRLHSLRDSMCSLLQTAQGFGSDDEPEMREELLKELEINQSDKVLQISMGAGENLGNLLKPGQYFIVDIPMKMKKMYKKRTGKDSINATVIVGEAEKLPLTGDIFDSVFSVCALRFINDKPGALQEMVRVAKPGAKIMIVEQRIAIPVGLVPPEMKQIQAKEFSALDLCCLTFHKPKPKRFLKRSKEA